MDNTTLKQMLADNNFSPAHMARVTELLEATGGAELSEEAKAEISEMIRVEIEARQNASKSLDMAEEALKAVITDSTAE